MGRPTPAISSACWAGEWLSWSDAALFWSRLVRWTIAAPFSQLDVQAQVEGDQVRAVLDARDREGTLLTDLEARAQIVGQNGAAALEQTAPGRYEGRLTVDEPGGDLVTVGGRRPGGGGGGRRSPGPPP